LAIAPIAVVTTLNFTIPLFTLVLARIFLKEAVDATRWIGTLVGFAGVMVVVQPGAAAFNPMWRGADGAPHTAARHAALNFEP
jgi:drug/metabolite transporter (DMT)-like permease